MIEVVCKRDTGRVKINDGNDYFVPVVDGTELNSIAETYDVALLLGLERKYAGLNSQFCKNACRMLGIKSAWAE